MVQFLDPVALLLDIVGAPETAEVVALDREFATGGSVTVTSLTVSQLGPTVRVAKQVAPAALPTGGAFRSTLAPSP